MLGCHVGPSDRRQQLHQGDPLVGTEEALRSLGEAQAASFVE
jgi:hypothetical protein